jgi:hypothetical protein
VVRQSFAAVALVALGVLRDPSCGGVDTPNGRTNAPCTRSSDCGGSLICLEGVCREPNVGPPASDSGRDAGGDTPASGEDDAGHDGS